MVAAPYYHVDGSSSSGRILILCEQLVMTVDMINLIPRSMVFSPCYMGAMILFNHEFVGGCVWHIHPWHILLLLIFSIHIFSYYVVDERFVHGIGQWFCIRHSFCPWY